MGIPEKIFAIMTSTRAIKRDKTIETTKGSYKVTTYEQALDIIRPLMIEQKLIIIRTAAKSQIQGNICLVDSEFEIIDVETGERQHTASIGAGHDISDKHAGKAMTYSLKYALRDLFLLCGSDDDDPDSQSSDRNVGKDLANAVSYDGLCELIDAAVLKGKCDKDNADNLKKQIFLIKQFPAELQKARVFIRNNLE